MNSPCKFFFWLGLYQTNLY